MSITPMNDKTNHRPYGTLLRKAVAVAAIGIGIAYASPISAQEADGDGADWPMYNHDHTGSRYNDVETTLSPASVVGLQVKWQYPTVAPVPGTPVVAGGKVYAGDMSGRFYALRSDGTFLWSRQLGGAVTATALITDSAVIVGDISGNLYGLKPSDGSVVWQMRPDAHPLAALWGSPTKVGKYVAIGVASNEESAAANPNYPCCSTRGSVVLLNPKTGAIVWKTSMITDAEFANHFAGASVWSTPTYDAASKLIYVTTGNNFTADESNVMGSSMSDAIVALDATTGVVAWVNQRTANDTWTYAFPISTDHPDFDFGDSPQVYRLAGGRKVVGAGQKSGFYHVVDAATGALVQQTQVEVAGSLGGLFADTAVANGIVFANGINWPNPSNGSFPTAGDLIALSGDGSQQLWKYTVPFSPVLGGVAVANSVVYFTATWSGKLFALSADTGSVLAAVPVGVSDSGPAVSRGQVYLGTGDALSSGFGGGPAPGSITALGL